MTVVAEVTVPADGFELGRLLEVEGGIDIRIERIVPTGGALFPHFWIPVEAAESVERELSGSDLVEDLEVIDVARDEALVRVEWSCEVNGLVGIIQDSAAVLLEARGLGDDWQFQLRFPDNDALSEFYSAARTAGVELRLDRIRDRDPGEANRPYGLTPKQREVLVAAVEHGYFDVPRRTSLVELGEELGISDSAASQRLRRGIDRVLSATLLSGRDRDRPQRD